MSASTAPPTLRQVIDDHLVSADPHVLTAHDRLNAPVTWVHSSEIFEIGPLLAGGELLLTTGLGLAGLDAGTRRHYVGDLAQRGVAGLAFEVGRTFDAVPEEMIREGSASRLPIIELRRVLPFIEVCRAANTAIVSGELAELRLRSALDTILHDDLSTATGVAPMLEHLAQVSKCPIVLIGSGGALLAAHGVDDDRSAWRAVDAARAWRPITVRGREIARVVAGPGEGTEDAHVAMLLEVAAGPLGAALSRSGSGRSAVGARLIEQLLDARPIRRSDLLARLASSGVSATDSAVLVTIAAEAPDARMAERVLAQATTGFGGLVYATVDATVHALVLITPDGHTDPVHQVQTAIAHIGSHTGRVTVVVGDGCPIAGTNPGLELALTLTNALHRCTERLGLAVELQRDTTSDDRVFSARALCAEDAIRSVDAAVREELSSIVEPLVRHDELQSTPLLHTLDVHLRHGCSATRSAEVLHIGRQSLYQRLDRIRGLLGFDPTAADVYSSVLLGISAIRAERSGRR